MAGREAALSGGLEERTAQDGALLARATGVIASLQVRRPPAPSVGGWPHSTGAHTLSSTCPCLQVDVGGLLWELDQRFGSSFHEEVAAALPAVLAARAVPGAAAAVSTASASPEALLSAAQERVNLLRRAFDTITGLQAGSWALCCSHWNVGAAAPAAAPQILQHCFALPSPSISTDGRGRLPL